MNETAPDTPGPGAYNYEKHASMASDTMERTNHRRKPPLPTTRGRSTSPTAHLGGISERFPSAERPDSAPYLQLSSTHKTIYEDSMSKTVIDDFLCFLLIYKLCTSFP